VLCAAILCSVFLFLDQSNATSCHHLSWCCEESHHLQQCTIPVRKKTCFCRSLWSPISKQGPSGHILPSISILLTYPGPHGALFQSAAIPCVDCDGLTDFSYVFLVESVFMWPLWAWLMACVPIIIMLTSCDTDGCICTHSRYMLKSHMNVQYGHFLPKQKIMSLDVVQTCSHEATFFFLTWNMTTWWGYTMWFLLWCEIIGGTSCHTVHCNIA
jgi:hypothetical protein